MSKQSMILASIVVCLACGGSDGPIEANPEELVGEYELLSYKGQRLPFVEETATQRIELTRAVLLLKSTGHWEEVYEGAITTFNPYKFSLLPPDGGTYTVDGTSIRFTSNSGITYEGEYSAGRLRYSHNGEDYVWEESDTISPEGPDYDFLGSVMGFVAPDAEWTLENPEQWNTDGSDVVCSNVQVALSIPSIQFYEQRVIELRRSINAPSWGVGVPPPGGRGANAWEQVGRLRLPVGTVAHLILVDGGALFCDPNPDGAVWAGVFPPEAGTSIVTTLYADHRGEIPWFEYPYDRIYLRRYD